MSRRIIGYLICLLAFVIVAWSFYPGLMTADSIANLAQGRAGVYADINAPLMSWLWGRLDEIVPGPSLIFVIHLVTFWAACAVMWRVTSSRSISLAIALVAVGLAPHILSQTIVVWKDVALGVSLLMSIALVFLARSERSKFALFLSALFLFYGYAARLNAFPGVLPIAIWTGFVASEIFEFESRRFAALLLGVGYFVVLSGGIYFVNSALTDGKTTYPFQQVYLYDLAAMSVRNDAIKFPQYIRDDPEFSPATVRSRYNERSVSDLIFPNVPNVGDKPPLKLSNDGTEVAELRTAWCDAIVEDPGAYLGHRSRVFGQLTGLGRSVTAPYVAEGFESSPTEFRGNANLGYSLFMNYFSLFRRPVPQTLFHRAVIWIAICLMLGWVAVKRKLAGDGQLVFVLSLSSLFFVVAYFPTAPSTEFRYLFWPAIATAVATIFGIYLWRSEKPKHAVRASDF